MSPRDQGLEALRAGDAAGAIELFRQAVQQTPQDGHAWGGLGIAYCQAGRVAEGVGALEKAVALVPNQASLHYNLGRALEQVQRTVDALSAYQRAAQLDSAHRQAAAAVVRLSAAVPHSLPPAPPFSSPSASSGPHPSPAPPPIPPVPPSPLSSPVPSVPFGGTPPPVPGGAPTPPPEPPPAMKPVPGLGDFALPGAGPAATPIPPSGPPAPAPASPASPWAAPGAPLPPPGPPPAVPSFGAGSSPAIPPPIDPALLAVPTRPTPGAWPPSAFSGTPDPSLPGAAHLWTGAGNSYPTEYGGSSSNPQPTHTGPIPGSSPPSSGSAGANTEFKIASGVLLGIVVLGLFVLKNGARVWRASRHFGTGLNSSQPGPRVQDARLGFSVAFPAAFKTPAPRQVPGTRIGVNSAGYGATTGFGEVFVSATEVGSGGQEGNRLIHEVRQGLEKARRLQGIRALPRPHQGRAGEEFRFTATEGGKTRHGRVRIVADPPRVFTVGCILNNERDLNAQGVERFLDSLNISPVYARSTGMGTVAGRVGGTPERATIPRFQPRAMPEISHPDLTPAEIPRPSFSRPSFSRPSFSGPEVGHPDFPRVRPGDPGYRPGGAHEPPSFPTGPSGGPRGPRFGPPGSGPGGPSFGPGGAGGPAGPGGSPIGPGGPGGPGGRPFGPGGPGGTPWGPGSAGAPQGFPGN